MRAIALAALLLASCVPAQPAATHRSYAFAADLPSGPLAPGDELRIVWRATERAPSAGVADVVACVAFFGPWSSAATLKSAMADRAIRSCPPEGAAAASEVARTRSDDGTSLVVRVRLPAAPGLYDVRTISIAAEGDFVSSQVGGGIIEIRPR